MIIEKYTREYENLRDSFKCGNNIIDNFLREGNALDENQGITYVMLSAQIINSFHYIHFVYPHFCVQ